MISSLYFACFTTGMLRLLAAEAKQKGNFAVISVVINLVAIFIMTFGGFGLVITTVGLLQ